MPGRQSRASGAVAGRQSQAADAVAERQIPAPGAVNIQGSTFDPLDPKYLVLRSRCHVETFLYSFLWIVTVLEAFVWLGGGYGYIINNICWFPGIVVVACSHAAVQDDSRVPPWFVVSLGLYFFPLVVVLDHFSNEVLKGLTTWNVVTKTVIKFVDFLCAYMS